MTAHPAIDQAKLEQFMGTLIGYMTGAAACFGMWLGASLSQEVRLGLGAQAGEARLREVFEEAGFKQFRRAAETPLNLILEAKP
jgi:hypothetical protein